MARRKPQWDGLSIPDNVPPPESGHRKIPVLKICPLDPRSGPGAYELVICSEQAYQIAVHYDGKRTQPCTGPRGSCWADHDHFESKWQGWLHVIWLKDKRNYAVSLTKNTVFEAPDLIGHAQGLRGGRLSLWRGGNSMQAVMRCKLDLEDRYPPELLPFPLDLPGLLLRMWSAPTRKYVEETDAQRSTLSALDRDERGQP